MWGKMLENKRVRWGFVGLVLLAAPGLAGCQARAYTLAKLKVAAQDSIQASEPAPAPDQVLAKADPVDPEAQYDLALTLLDTDPATAVLWLERAAMQGHGDAAYRLGLLQDTAKRRVEWYSMAAAVGQVDAQYALGDAYLNGRGTAKEPAWGLSWLERAARAGQAQAQFSMGVAMATGLVGVSQRAEGLVWLLIAERNHFAHAGPVISVLKARLSPAAIEQAIKRAKAWTNEPAGDAKNRAIVRFVQYALGRLGFDSGLPDGITGTRTNAAITAFRLDRGLGAGTLDGRVLDILRARLAALNR